MCFYIYIFSLLSVLISAVTEDNLETPAIDFFLIWVKFWNNEVMSLNYFMVSLFVYRGRSRRAKVYLVKKV